MSWLDKIRQRAVMRPNRELYARVPHRQMKEGHAEVVTRPDGTQVALVEKPHYDKLLKSAGLVALPSGDKDGNFKDTPNLPENYLDKDAGL